MHSLPEFAPQLEELQRICFPTFGADHRFKAAHYLKQMALFDEGQLLVLDRDRVVASTTTLRLNFDFQDVGHTFADISQGGWLTSHDPNGAWLYGADMGVRPEYRGQGLATALYAARQEVVWRLGLRGQVIAGMLPGYDSVRKRMSVETYYAQILQGKLSDPTVSAQMKVGFEPLRLLRDYFDDPVCDNCGVLMVLDAAKDVRGASRRHARSFLEESSGVLA
jgi:GNAT superfamily N-acetyltransferase